MEPEHHHKQQSSVLAWVAGILLFVALVEGWLLYRNSKPENTYLMPPYSFSDSQWKDGFFSAHGSWISDTKLANPVQTVELDCWKEFGYCFENIAQISDGNFINVSSDLHTIERWTEAEITTKPEESAAGCVTYRMQIDRATQRVTSSRITKNNTSGLCEGMQKEPIVSYMGDGLKRLDVIKKQDD